VSVNANVGSATGKGTGQPRVGLMGVLMSNDAVMAAAVMLVVMMMIIPLPAIVLDLFITLNIALTVTVLLVAMYITEPLQFSVFPSLLLVLTLFRLGISVAATRLILLQGFAGDVIQAFGQFVVGGNVVIGLVMFLILMVIQFVVITSGAGRVAEVAARFTLDAMPGKQMSVDSELAAGFITEHQARAQKGRGAGGRLLRGYGRREQVRARRRHRRPHHDRHQSCRWVRRRGGTARA